MMLTRHTGAIGDANVNRFTWAIDQADGFRGRFVERFSVTRKDCAKVSFLEVDAILFGKRFMLAIRQRARS
jgi:hypothetical protein